MFDVLLHTGTEHPNLSLIVLSSILSFVAGVGAIAYSKRIREFTRELGTASAE